MLSIEDRNAFTKAEAKAREVKPRVTVKDYAAGEYTVDSGQAGKDPYTVKFSKDAGGHWQAECNCWAHTRSKEPKACYHIPAAYSSHRIQVNIHKQVRAALEVAPAAEAPSEAAERFCTCGELATSKAGYCDFCQVEFDRTTAIAQTEKDYADLLEPIYQADAEYKAAQARPASTAPVSKDGWVVCPDCGETQPAGPECLRYGCHVSLEGAAPVQVPVEVQQVCYAPARNQGDNLPGSQYELPAVGRCPHCKRPFMSDEYDCYYQDCPGKNQARPGYTEEAAAHDRTCLFG